MNSKLPWVVVVVLSIGLIGSLGYAQHAAAQRKTAEEEVERVQKAKTEADGAAAKALAAREAAETEKQNLDSAKKQSDEQLAASQNALAVMKQQLAEQTKSAPMLETELANARRALADAQRKNGIAASKETPVIAAKIATPHRAPGGWSVPEMLPPDTIGLITLRDVPTVVTKSKETGLYKILAHPDFERVFRKQLGQARGAIFAGEMMLGEKLTDLLSFVSQGEITFAVLGVDKRLPDGKPFPDLMLSIELRDKAPAFLEEFNKRLDQLKAATNGNLQYTQTPLGNTTVTRFKYADFPGEISCGLCDGTFLICLGDGRLEKLMAMRQKMKAAPAKQDAAEPEVSGASFDLQESARKSWTRRRCRRLCQH